MECYAKINSGQLVEGMSCAVGRTPMHYLSTADQLTM